MERGFITRIAYHTCISYLADRPFRRLIYKQLVYVFVIASTIRSLPWLKTLAKSLSSVFLSLF